MKYYDKSMYKTEQNVKIILTILLTFVIGFFIGYWCRGFENDKGTEKNVVEQNQIVQVENY